MSRGKTTQPSTNNYQRHSKRERKHWLEYAVCFFLVITALATGYAAYYTKQQWISNSIASKEQLRAYVGALPGNMEEFYTGGNTGFDLKRQNFGVTPAYEVGLSSHNERIVVPGEIPLIPITRCGGRPAEIGLISLFPTMRYTTKMLIRNLTPAQINDVINGTSALMAYGEICYYDAFGAAHFTHYCWIYKGESMTAKDAIACKEYNDSN